MKNVRDKNPTWMKNDPVRDKNPPWMKNVSLRPCMGLQWIVSSGDSTSIQLLKSRKIETTCMLTTQHDIKVHILSQS